MANADSAEVRSLCILAGRGAYPEELARSAREQGVAYISAIGFHGETRKSLALWVDEIRWVYVGHLDSLLKAVQATRATHAVMVGQIKPSNLFLTRLDASMRQLLTSLPRKNADTIFGAICDRLALQQVTFLPASRFMESAIPGTGLLSLREPDMQEWADIRQGIEVAKWSAAAKVGQSVVIKQGTVIAVEAFEGTDRTICRAGRVGGAGGVVVKVAQPQHDMRFDIPVIGLKTLKSMKKARCRCLAIEAGKTILLEKDRLIQGMDAAGIALVAVEMDHA